MCAESRFIFSGIGFATGYSGFFPIRLVYKGPLQHISFIRLPYSLAREG